MADNTVTLTLDGEIDLYITGNISNAGNSSVIGQLADLVKIMDGGAGTLISNEVDGIQYGEYSGI